MKPVNVRLASAIVLIAVAAGCGSDDEPRPPAAIASDPGRNLEAVIPPQCYTRTEGRFNPCYTCHQSYAGRERPNFMRDGYLQGEYAFSEFGMTNHWSNLFCDRSEAVAAIDDETILG